MTDLLTPEMLSQIGMWSAVFSEPAHQQRLAELMEKLAEISALQDSIKATQEDIWRQHAESEQLKTDAEAHEVRLQEWEGRVTAINDALNQEKIAFQAVREKVEAENAAETDRLAALDEKLKDREDAVAAREAAVEQQEALLDKSIASHHAKVERLRDALADPSC